MRIAVLNGPNLNLLGTREPALYGSTTLPEIEARLRDVARELRVEIECAQHNGEGALIDAIQGLRGRADAAIINVGGIFNRLHVKGQMTGTVVNTLGYLANIDVNLAMDSAFVGLPVGHVNIRAQDNVQVYSSIDREVGSRNGVILVSPLRPVGPLLPPR